MSFTVGWPLYSDPTVEYTPYVAGGGSWLTVLPLANVQHRDLSRVARSTDAATANTQFDVDLRIARPVFVLAVPVHTCTASATVRVRGSATAGSFTSPVYDTSTVNMFASALSAEDREDFNAGWFHVCSAVASARYWRFEFADTGNPDGFIDVGRVVVAGGWQPSVNMERGGQLGWESASASEDTESGGSAHQRRRLRRLLKVVVGDVPEDEALLNAFDQMRRHDTHSQVVVVYDSSDTIHMHRRAFLATLAELTALNAVIDARYGVPLSFREVL